MEWGLLHPLAGLAWRGMRSERVVLPDRRALTELIQDRGFLGLMASRSYLWPVVLSVPGTARRGAC
jgi:hypothetical protein